MIASPLPNISCLDDKKKLVESLGELFLQELGVPSVKKHVKRYCSVQLGFWPCLAASRFSKFEHHLLPTPNLDVA
ncbi:unnamed protein product [Malus baccata var. baccata]